VSVELPPNGERRDDLQADTHLFLSGHDYTAL